jgi:4-alpha-glucanotransferase
VSKALVEKVPNSRKNLLDSAQTQPLHTLAELHGIEVEYQDGMSNWQVVPDTTLQIILGSMNIKTDGPDDIQRALEAVKEKPWTHLIEEVILLPTHDPSPAVTLAIPLFGCVAHQVGVRWELQDENGNKTKGSCLASSLKSKGTKFLRGLRYSRRVCPLPASLKMGYYTLSIFVDAPSGMVKGQSLIIVAPPRCYEAPAPKKYWGITLQLYGLRGSGNWGIGDFQNLRKMTSWVGKRLGAGMVGLNPLHTLTPGLSSPYSPSSRLFHNPLYLHIESIQEFRTTPSIRQWVARPSFQAKLQALRSRDTVDYAQVHTVKWTVLEKLYRAFCRQHLRPQTRRAKAFHQFCQEGGELLFQFALFQTLDEAFGWKGWTTWPKKYHHPWSPAVLVWAKKKQDRIRFYQYVEWQCELQLHTLDKATTEANMPMGLYHDLAIGVHPGGADTWMFQGELVSDVSIGAPPDKFNLSGQNWGLNPMHPQKLRESGYRMFRETIRKNMGHGGLLRIDHALGLFRLFWIPNGVSGEQGAYVRYRTDELLAILAVESVRHKVVVIGEDLGTVTPTIRRRLAKGGLLSYRLLMFENIRGRGFQSPEQFPAQALMSVNTHDLPTLKGFWNGRDIVLKERIGLYPSSAIVKGDWQNRQKDRKALVRALKQEQLLSARSLEQEEHTLELTEDLCRSIYAYVARSSCQVVAISLEDLLGEIDTPNIPGAPPGSYPVWERKLVRAFEQWKHDRHIQDFGRMFRRERNRKGNGVSRRKKSSSRIPRLGAHSS